LTQCHRLNDKGGCLRPAVTTAAHDEGNEQGKHCGCFDLMCKKLHGRCGKHLTKKKYHQPACTFADQFENADIKIWFIQCLGTSDLLNVFGKLLTGDPQHIINGYYSQKDALVVGNGKGYT